MDTCCYKGLTGEVITPESPAYEEVRQEWNRAIQKYPAVIVRCHTKADVSNAIRWAGMKRIGIRIRSGGHHYEGYSVGNGILVIDISRMNRIKLYPAQKLVKLQGGVMNTQLYERVSGAGYPFPGGTCPTVGVTGYTLGGGWGFSSRAMGLGCDSLVALELIDYRGRLLKASSKTNSDLYWACRGAGGGNFGVVVSMTFRLPPKVEKVTLVQLYYPNSSQETMQEFLNIWQAWLPDADHRITINASLYNDASEGRGIFGRGIFYGRPDEAVRLLKPFAKLKGIVMTAQYLPFLAAVQQVEESYPPAEKFKSTGRFVYRHYDEKEICKIVNLIQRPAEGSSYAAITVYALGGKISTVGEAETAYYYRLAHYIMGIQSVWLNDDFAGKNIEWIDQRFKYLEKITKGSYVNFPYSGLKDYEKAYFGKNALRLQEVNKKYDPYHVFHFPQAIR